MMDDITCSEINVVVNSPKFIRFFYFLEKLDEVDKSLIFLFFNRSNINMKKPSFNVHNSSWHTVMVTFNGSKNGATLSFDTCLDKKKLKNQISSQLLLFILFFLFVSLFSPFFWHALSLMIAGGRRDLSIILFIPL